VAFLEYDLQLLRGPRPQLLVLQSYFAVDAEVATGLKESVLLILIVIQAPLSIWVYALLALRGHGGEFLC